MKSWDVLVHILCLESREEFGVINWIFFTSGFDHFLIWVFSGTSLQEHKVIFNSISPWNFHFPFHPQRKNTLTFQVGTLSHSKHTILPFSHSGCLNYDPVEGFSSNTPVSAFLDCDHSPHKLDMYSRGGLHQLKLKSVLELGHVSCHMSTICKSL